VPNAPPLQSARQGSLCERLCTTGIRSVEAAPHLRQTRPLPAMVGRLQNNPSVMKRTVRRELESPLEQAAIGIVGGLLGAWAMNVFARAVRATRNGREAEGAAPGADRHGRGPQPPQAHTTSDQDAAVKAGSSVYRAVTGDEPSGPTQRWLGTAAHYAFGASTGLAYGVLANRAPVLKTGYGFLYGALVWAVADEGLMPALGLSRGPREQRPGIHAYALLSHFVYGATLEAVRQYGSDVIQRMRPRLLA
jgi:putative membrane protein